MTFALADRALGALRSWRSRSLAYLLVQRRRKKYVVRFTNLALLENVVAASPRWRRHVPPALTLLALAALVVGVARPEVAVRCRVSRRP